VLKDRLIPMRTLGEQAFERLTHFKGHDVLSMMSYGPLTLSVM